MQLLQNCEWGYYRIAYMIYYSTQLEKTLQFLCHLLTKYSFLFLCFEYLNDIMRYDPIKAYVRNIYFWKAAIFSIYFV